MILQWIADQFPQRKLLPSFGTRERYEALAWLNFVATDLHRGMAVMFSPSWMALRRPTSSAISRAKGARAGLALACPTLLVRGEQDGFIPPYCLDALQGLIVGTVVERMAYCGHLPYLEDPVRFNAVVERFLRTSL